MIHFGQILLIDPNHAVDARYKINTCIDLWQMLASLLAVTVASWLVSGDCRKRS